MPLNKAERKMKKNLEKVYGKGRGEKIFYSMESQKRTPKMAKGGLVKKKTTTKAKGCKK